MSLYENLVPQYKKMLRNLDAWIETSVAFAAKKSFDPNTLLNARLAPDQYPLVRQVQSVCDSAKFACAYLSGQKAPAHPDTEATIGELRARIATCLAYLETITPHDFEGAEKRMITLPWAPGKQIAALDYVYELSLPNFYFHATTAYAILRHNGVDVGKMAYIGSVKFLDA